MGAEGFRADLNGLRGLSVALVVAYHLQLRGAGGGFVGVDVFFVLSGYLMTKIICDGLDTQRFSYWGFVAARAARIWPALAVMVLLLFALGAWGLPPFDLVLLAEQAARALLFVSNHHYLAGAGYITHAGDTLWLLHTWSLSVEWQFYLLYPLLLMGVARLAGAGPLRHRLGFGLVLLLAMSSLALQLWHSRTQPDAAFFLLPDRAWELLAGGLAFFLRRERAPAARWGVAASHVGFLLVLGGVLLLALLRTRAVGAGALLLPVVLGTGLVLWAGHTNHPVLRHGVLQRLGLWSYSIYLWHWPLIIGLRMTDLPDAHPVPAAVLTAVAAVLLGWLSYTWVERPGRALRAAAAWRGARKAVLALLLAGGVTGVATATDGFAFRREAGDDFYRDYWDTIKPLYFPDDCGNFKKPSAQMQPCLLRKAGPARTLVIGDSHAEHLYAWFARHSPGSVDFFTAAECPPVPRLRRQQPGYDCEGYAARAWGQATSAGYETVIVSARWATAGLAGAPYCHEQDGRCVAPPSLADKQRVIRDELKAAIGAALVAGKTVVMVDGSPEARFRVPERLARELYWHGEVRSTVALATLSAQTAWLEPLFDALRGTPRFHRVSLRDVLCDTQRCRLYDSVLKRPVFFDESHFDPVWIAQQRTLFAAYLPGP
ncbi:MAG TPA: acyltransferase family protein [Rhizobacter sp.]